jgi:preprotein translocase subunit SecG
MVKIALTAFHVILSVGLIAVVIMQSGRSAGLAGAISGGAESFLGKKKGLDQLLSKLTIGVAVLYAVTSIILVIL